MAKRKPKDPQPKRQSKRSRKVSPIPITTNPGPCEPERSSSLTPVHSRSQSPPAFVPASSLPLDSSPRADSPPFTQPATTLERSPIKLDSMPFPISRNANSSSPVRKTVASHRAPEEYNLPKQRWTHFRQAHGGRKYIDSSLANRLNECRIRAKPAMTTFSIDKLDFPLKFGPKTYGPGDRSAYVCLGDDPVKVWIVGEIQALGFRKGQNNCRRAAVLINPFRPEDRTRMKDILTILSHPPEGRFLPLREPYLVNSDIALFTHSLEPEKEDIWIGKWMAAPGVDDASVPAFTQAFDLCDGVDDAPEINTGVLKQYDIVCVEALINRYTKRTRNNSNGWKEWRINLELSRLFLLYSMEPGVRVEVDTDLF